MVDGFSNPRERIAAHPTFMAYCLAQSDDSLARLIWDADHQRNVFASYSGTSGDHARTVVAAITERATRPLPTTVRDFLGKVQGVCLGVAMSGRDHPNPDGALMELFNEAQAILFPRAANKANGSASIPQRGGEDGC